MWDEAAATTLREMWETGSTATEIGSEIGATRNAVMGKVRRLGLHRYANPNTIGKTSKPKGDARIGNVNASVFQIVRRTKARKSDPGIKRRRVHAAPVKPLNIPLVNIERGQCRHIAGDDNLMCGHPVEPGQSWCPWHCGVVFEKPEKRK